MSYIYAYIYIVDIIYVWIFLFKFKFPIYDIIFIFYGSSLFCLHDYHQVLIFFQEYHYVIFLYI